MSHTLTILNYGDANRIDPATVARWKLASIGPGGIVYDAAPIARPIGHEHWCMPSATNTYIEGYFKKAVLDTSGVVYPFTWGEIEPSPGVFNWTSLLRAIRFCAQNGKRFIPRVRWKTYFGNVNAVPLDLVLLQRPVYLNNVAVGKCAMLESPAVMSRFQSMLQSLADALRNEPNLAGLMFDESAQSCIGPSGMPVGLTGDMIVSFMINMYDFARAIFKVPVYPNINYVEGGESQPIADARTRSLRDRCIRVGMPIGVTDTFTPSMRNQYLQPIYMDMPIPIETLMHVDYLSMSVPPDQLNARMIDCAQTTYALGASKTVWCVRDGSEPGSVYWPPVLNAILNT